MKKGDAVFIRTVTYHYTGRIKRITRTWIELEDATWIAESGRFHAALANGTIEEAEEMPGRVLVAKATIVDVSEWKHALPVTTR